MKLNPNNKYCFDQKWGWVGHPDAYPTSPIEQMLRDRRFELEIIGGVEDAEANYSYDEFALVKLDADYYLLSTCGCSCPSPSETWGLELGPATLSQIREHIKSGAYAGYTLPKKQESEFLALLDAAEAGVS